MERFRYEEGALGVCRKLDGSVCSQGQAGRIAEALAAEAEEKSESRISSGLGAGGFEEGSNKCPVFKAKEAGERALGFEGRARAIGHE